MLTLLSEGFADFDGHYTTSPQMLEEADRLLKDQPCFCKIVRKINKQYEVKLWLMETRSGEDDSNTTMSVNERLLAIKRLDVNKNPVDAGKR